MCLRRVGQMTMTPTATFGTAHIVRFRVSRFDTTKAPARVSAGQGLVVCLNTERARRDSNPNLLIRKERGRISLRINVFHTVLPKHPFGSRCCCSVSVNVGHRYTVCAHGCAHA